jgi:16S rRNA C1402 N4-methylase RsmH
VMSYHSGEDTIVKQAFAQLEEQWHGYRVTKKVIMPSYQEQQRNKASRSAKLRVWEKDDSSFWA